MVRVANLAALCATFAAPAFAAISIVSPSPGSYFVQFASNTISWVYGSGDPSTVSLEIINQNETSLNGVFSIAEYVDTSIQSFTITNVTLKLGSGYQVQFVNSTNNTIVYAKSGLFDVRPNGTAPAPTSALSSVVPVATSVGPSGSVLSARPSGSSGAPASASSGANSAGVSVFMSREAAAGGLLGLAIAAGTALLL